MGYSIAVVGATGLVGRTMLAVLEERNFPISRLKLLASEKSAGEVIAWKGAQYRVEELKEDSFGNVDVALFSAGGSVSRRFAPICAASGAVAIDNSSAWRMDAEVPLIVPEANAEEISKHKGIIANPNCSTIQLTTALKPIDNVFGLQRVAVSTYQSVSGAGKKGIEHLSAELRNESPTQRISPKQLAYNAVFHSFAVDSDQTDEEVKIELETKKILNLPHLRISATCVRIPVLGGHGESVAIETERAISPESVRELLESASGIRVLDNPKLDVYPTMTDSSGSDDVFVGRIRRDRSVQNGLLLWIVADNVRKGAATNAVQIAEIVLNL